MEKEISSQVDRAALTIKSYSKIYLIEKLVSAVLMPEFTDAE